MSVVNKISTLLQLGAKLTTELAETRGAAVLKESKEVLIDLKGAKAYKEKLVSLFCPNAREPKMLVNYDNNSALNRIGVRFMDGDTGLSRTTFSRAKDGCIDFDLCLMGESQTSHLVANGRYNPNVKFFEWNNCGETLEHRYGRTIAQLDSSGFFIRADVNDQSALKVIRKIRDGIKEL